MDSSFVHDRELNQILQVATASRRAEG